MTLRIRRIATDLCLLVLFFGCNNNVARVTIPDWDPSGFTQAILDKLDKNGNEAIDQPELAEAPGLTFGARFIDQNGDGKLGRDELEARFAKYRDIRVGLMPKELRVTYNGQP